MGIVLQLGAIVSNCKPLEDGYDGYYNCDSVRVELRQSWLGSGWNWECFECNGALEKGICNEILWFYSEYMMYAGLGGTTWMECCCCLCSMFIVTGPE